MKETTGKQTINIAYPSPPIQSGNTNLSIFRHATCISGLNKKEKSSVHLDYSIETLAHLKQIPTTC